MNDPFLELKNMENVTDANFSRSAKKPRTGNFFRNDKTINLKTSFSLELQEKKLRNKERALSILVHVRLNLTARQKTAPCCLSREVYLKNSVNILNNGIRMKDLNKF